MIHLHYSPGTASMAPHIVLEEIGAPYQLVRIDQEGGELASAAYRKLNPNGLIPVLRDGELVLYETAAICLHLADTHPEAALVPPVGSAARAEFYKWQSWLATTLQTALIVYFYPQRWADDAAAVAQVKAHAQAKATALLEQIDAQLAGHGGPWLLGEQYGVADGYAMMLCRWTRNFDGRKARDFPHLAPWLQRVLARPAVQRVFAREELAEPWV
ncbi:glutathione S-transferase family protein [Chitinimonas koreensis]|uniref:glutathione S-transferase family protein n=1 Tax=Chitinimonas koreensis TaxID=356302 RepID=UPI00041089C7|nr:glutathione S-transferase family protein [Chitinimonas koreensis]QNM97988.1 glutathione S-transferase family protein [Chitinimonas koreensis]